MPPRDPIAQQQHDEQLHLALNRLSAASAVTQLALRQLRLGQGHPDRLLVLLETTKRTISDAVDMLRRLDGTHVEDGPRRAQNGADGDG